MLIRVDMCVTFEVPEGSRVNDDGEIELPDGRRIQHEPVARYVRHSDTLGRDYPASIAKKEGEEPFRHVYYTTPVEVTEVYTG